jgi:hypothetical protein
MNTNGLAAGVAHLGVRQGRDGRAWPQGSLSWLPDLVVAFTGSGVCVLTLSAADCRE